MDIHQILPYVVGEKQIIKIRQGFNTLGYTITEGLLRYKSEIDIELSMSLSQVYGQCLAFIPLNGAIQYQNNILLQMVFKHLDTHMLKINLELYLILQKIYRRFIEDISNLNFRRTYRLNNTLICVRECPYKRVQNEGNKKLDLTQVVVAKTFDPSQHLGRQADGSL